MVAFSFREFTNLLNKTKRLPEIAKPEAPLDAVSVLRQLPVRGLCMKELSLLARERRNSPATRRAKFYWENLIYFGLGPKPKPERPCRSVLTR